ncbi:MAG: Flp family type IVb pilin [Glycocaulis sp.]
MGHAARSEQLPPSACRHSAGRRAARPALITDTRGATAIEYALLAGLIAIAIIAALSVLGGGNEGMWTNIQTQVSEAMGGGEGG